MFTSIYLNLTPLKSSGLYILMVLLALSSCTTQKHTLSFNPATPLQHAGHKASKPVATDSALTAAGEENVLNIGIDQSLPEPALGQREEPSIAITASTQHEPAILPNEALSVAAGIYVPQQDTNYVREPKTKAYQDEPYYTNVAAREYSILSIISLACGLLGLLLLFTTFFPFFMGAAAVVLGILGIRQIRRQPLRWKGKGFAIAGLIIGILTILLFWLMISLVVLLLLAWGA